MNSSGILPRPSRRESPHAGECALKSPSTRKGFGSCSKSSARESFETGKLGGRYREQTVRVFSRLIVAAAACRPVFKSISEKRVPFLMRRAASPPRDPPREEARCNPKPAYLQGHNSRMRSIQQ
ncbi:nucleic-acid-binding protein from mobile element jockey [Plakobranchus ocellatus]|uniref:Nucleic-acid-binding protein from mobile element jockey n=1 Tax=Plakobranchus ocellatus TaxID=259542 RepID=A0AAV4DHS0_9GAST|nr:nucleic-acid-binding protein from mobile element jockey [Plakobranchus ocellatus]